MCPVKLDEQPISDNATYGNDDGLELRGRSGHEEGNHSELRSKRSGARR
jgi:hypothetical protein